VLDTAALRLSVIDRPFSGNAALCLRTGYLCLRRIAAYFGIPYDEDPAATDPISVSRDEFDAMYVALEAGGLPVARDRDQAWRDFQGWRVNYDSVLVAIAKMIVAPEARWSSDRPGERMLPRMRRPGGAARVTPERTPRRR
jgi:hypothetical protein